MTTQVNELGLTTETTVYRVSIDGPAAKKPSGKFKEWSVCGAKFTNATGDRMRCERPCGHDGDHYGVTDRS